MRVQRRSDLRNCGSELSIGRADTSFEGVLRETYGARAQAQSPGRIGKMLRQSSGAAR